MKEWAIIICICFMAVCAGIGFYRIPEQLEGGALKRLEEIKYQIQETDQEMMTEFRRTVREMQAIVDKFIEYQEARLQPKPEPNSL